MAYGLKYSQYITKGGATIQIRVYVKDYSGASYGMAHLTGASLQIIGGQSDPLTPIIKTALSWSLADCWDEGTTQADGTECVNAQGEKCGRWEEFYTPDATKFRVELWAAQTASATPACIWTGYITPDSWSENMIYRGSITITARDMLGALQEKEFNLTGRVSILDIVQGALSACAAPMALSYTAGHFLVNSNGQSILAHTIAASTFSGDNWQTALEDTLESLGLVLRYNGANGLVLAPLRYVREDTPNGSHTIEFANRSGLRELVPALRSITETFDIDVVNIPASDPAASQFAATGGTITQVVVAHTSCGTFTNTHHIPGYTLTESGGEGWSGGLATPAPGTPIEGIPERKMWFPTDVTDAVRAVWNNPRLRGSYAVKIEQDGPVAWWTGSAPNTHLAPFYGNNTIKEIEIQVVAVVNGTTKYLSPSGSWDTAENTIHYAIGSEINVPDCGAVGEKIIIKKVITECTYPASRALFVALNLSVQPATEGSTIISEYKTTTEYDQKNNVTITRSPKVGSATLSGCVDFYENVLAYGDAIAPDEWNWPGASDGYPLAVMIQAQVLCYHAAAASVFTGTAHDKNAGAALALPGCGYTYYERNCVPVSGIFDFASGFLAQSNFREVYSWEDVWGASFDPEYTRTQGAGRGSTSATGAGGSSVSPGGGSSGGGGGVNYFELSGSDVQLKSAYEKLILPVLQVTGNTTIGGTLGVTGAATLSSTLAVAGLATLSGGISLGGTYNSQDSKLVWDATNNAWHLIGNFYADGFISAGGISPGGGASAGNATLVAQTYGGTLSATGIDEINFYSKERVDQLLLTAGTVQTVAGIAPTNGDIPVASLKSALGLGAAAAYGVGSVASGNTGLVTGGSVYSAINEAVSSVMKMQGTTTTPLSDGSTTNPVDIDGSSYTAKKGDVVLYDGKEYLWAGSAWKQLGDEASWALKTTSISAGTGLEGGGTLASNRTISISPTYQTYISHGESAYNSLGDYLPLSGGTLSANNTAILNIDSTHTSGNNWIYFKVSGANKAAVGYYAGLAFISNEATYARIGVNDAGVPQYWDDSLGGSGHSFTIFHSGNSNLSTVDWAAKQMTANSFKLASGTPTLTWDATNSAWHLSGNFYADGFISAGGISPGGGTSGIDLAAMWTSLRNTPTSASDINANTKIAAAHIPDMASTYGYLKSADAVANVALKGDYLRVTKNGANTDLTIPYASRAGYVDGTNYGNWDANSPGNYQYLWYYGQSGGVSNFPHNLVGSYGSVVTFLSGGSSQPLHAQLAWGVNHDSTNASNGIAWRAKNNLGWDTTWHRLYDDNYHPTADNASTLNGQPGSYYAAASSLSSYLPLTGGTLSAAGIPLNLNSSETFSGITFASGGTIFSRLVSYTGDGILRRADALWSHEYIIYDSGNLSLATLAGSSTIGGSTTPIYYNGSSLVACDLSTTYAPYNAAGYLPLTGGTLSADSENILNIDSTYASGNNWIFFKVSGTSKAAVGYYSGLAFISNEATYARIGVNDAGVPQYWEYPYRSSAKTLYHSGNSNLSTVPWTCSELTADKIKFAPDANAEIGQKWSTGDSNVYSYIRHIGYNNPYLTTHGRGPGIEYIAGTWTSGGSAAVHRFYVTQDVLALAICNDGNVGIGTTSPAYKLDVNGSVGCSTLTAAQTIRAGNGYSIAVGTPGASGSSAYANYISAGPGYSANSGRYGVKILVCDQSDAQTGLGQDVVTPTGWSNAYNLCVIGGNSPSEDYGYISFTTHKVNSNSYRYLGGFRDNAGAITFQVIGNIIATGAITAGSASDARLKTNIQPLSAETAKRIVMALNPVTFTWNSTATELYDQYKGDDLGFIAQEVEPYLPQAIGTIFEKYMRLDQTKVIAPLVAVAQDHETRIRQLERENAELKRRLNMN